MKKKMLPLLILLGSSAVSFAQTTLTAANFNPVIADAYALKICDPTGVTPGMSGPAVTWNFNSSLHATSTDTGKVVACGSTPNCALFTGSNVAIKGPGISRTTNYYAESTAGLDLYGYYTAPDTNLVLSNPAKQFTYPFTYGSTVNDTYAGILTLGANTAHQSGTITTTCDGYGTLILPGRADTGVLRVHSLESFTDSISLFGSPVVLNYVLETYSWYKPNYHLALLTINTVTSSGSSSPDYTFVAYAPAMLAGVPTIPNDLASLNLYPNPVQDELNIDLDVKSAAHVRISLLDMTGREIAVISDKAATGAQHISYNTAALAKGVYMVRVQSGESVTTRKVVLQ